MLWKFPYLVEFFAFPIMQIEASSPLLARWFFVPTREHVESMFNEEPQEPKQSERNRSEQGRIILDEGQE